MSKSNLLMITTLGLFLTIAESMRFDLQSGHTKCISEDIKNSAITVGKYNVVNPNEGYPLPDTHKLNVRVTSPYGNNYHHGDQVDSGNFAFTAAEAGDYTTCFTAPDHKPETTVAIEFEWKTGVAAKDWSKIAKKEQVEVMEIELKKLLDTVTSINEEMFHLRVREEEMQELNQSTNSKMAGLSFLSLVVCLSVAGLQLWHLKSHFERKKLL
ncbi:transmembrane emp24 domain-containing protein p24delta9-like [Populus alba x Populus x berolinensis]|nr:transmembrane emp24 domain-containing protein p24delta9-like [Populus alba x Populus x berolinensis]